MGSQFPYKHLIDSDKRDTSFKALIESSRLLILMKAGRLFSTSSNKWTYLVIEHLDPALGSAYNMKRSTSFDHQSLGSTLLVTHDDKPLPHIPFEANGLHIVSKSVKRILDEEVGNQVKILPVNITTSNRGEIKDYFFVQVLNCRASADIQQSDFSVHPESGDVTVFYNLVIKASELTQKSEVFRLAEHPAYTIVTNQLLNRLAKLEKAAITRFEVR
jgi:hypothetical protein